MKEILAVFGYPVDTKVFEKEVKIFLQTIKLVRSKLDSAFFIEAAVISFRSGSSLH